MSFSLNEKESSIANKLHMQDEMKMVKQILLKNVSSFTLMMKNSKHIKSKLQYS